MFGRRKREAAIVSIKTSKFDETVAFYRALEFEIIDADYDPLCPVFTEERGVRIRFDGYRINIEEDTSINAVSVFNVMLVEPYSESTLSRIASRVRNVEISEGIYGKLYSFAGPDGGIVTISSKG